MYFCVRRICGVDIFVTFTFSYSIHQKIKKLKRFKNGKVLKDLAVKTVNQTMKTS